ncbi:MAG: hypothetical protein Q9160_008380 [Pyrenula sp. 1 TL-2023]
MSRIPSDAGAAPLDSGNAHLRLPQNQLELKKKLMGVMNSDKRPRERPMISMSLKRRLGSLKAKMKTHNELWKFSTRPPALKRWMNRLTESTDLDLIETIIREEEEFNVVDQHLAVVSTRRPRNRLTSIRHAREFHMAQPAGYEELGASRTINDATATAEEDEQDFIPSDLGEDGDEYTPLTNGDHKTSTRDIALNENSVETTDVPVGNEEVDGDAEPKTISSVLVEWVCQKLSWLLPRISEEHEQIDDRCLGYQCPSHSDISRNLWNGALILKAAHIVTIKIAPEKMRAAPSLIQNQLMDNLHAAQTVSFGHALFVMALTMTAHARLT